MKITTVFTTCFLIAALSFAQNKVTLENLRDLTSVGSQAPGGT